MKYILLSLFLATCASAWGMSLEEEVKLGQAEHQKIIGKFGIYRDQKLQAYINQVGQRVAAGSSRPEVEYRFTILNDDMINAFALPGGFIYVTRGMLVHMNSESELAAVLGHEIAHVTEKHALRRQTRGKGISVLNTVLTAVSGQPALYELGNMFGGVLLSGYSREFELDADEVGAQYMAKAGYSPSAMLNTIEILKAKDRIEISQARLENRAPRVYHGILSTHPDHDTRYKQAITESEKLLRDYDEFIKTDEFLQKLNGLAYGKSRQVGVVRKNTFYHPKLGIKFTFPQSWRFETLRQGAMVVNQVGESSFTITTSRLTRGATPASFTREQLGLNVREGREITIDGMPAYLGIADKADTAYGPRPVRFAVIFDERKRLAYILRGAGKYDLRKIADDGNYIASIFSFDRMSREDFQRAKTPKVQVVRAEEDTTMEQLAEESPITNYALDTLRVMNGLYPHGQPEDGQLIKIIN
ncbi:MAG: M48 family metalloprotease [Gammaproteobacteria bacterium]|jgi:predicted Zn-dependent protease|nr:M48 family metalloprotease [Gammaproteobacteria bacterium]MBT3870186.1 M48 family metalloprotease [Gammaproteobacteria bacterium]MBT4378801.1 M48 family metalloprotease [Gammaproteobacteria bacterium]MBT5198489.1 M48 family metalloprotease [Gammaproteobacteria bacterium]MBT5443927.1 M48 family metalloprotease [Gammaproteobacteria bacterium]